MTTSCAPPATPEAEPIGEAVARAARCEAARAGNLDGRTGVGPRSSVGGATEQAPTTSRLASFVRGRTDDPVWVRPALLGMLGTTALLYLWSLGESGWANDYYSAAVQAGASSWKAFFFGSSDASNFITVDKAPAFLWPMVVMARIFGVNSWSILVPQALEGIATVGVLYLAVRRWFGPVAGLLAGGVMALTPVAALMFRYNNPDSLLVLLLTLGAYALVRAVDDGSTKWIVLVGVFVGFGFLAKMLQALLVVPAFGLVYLVAAPVALSTRIRQLVLSGLAMVASAGWWVAIVELWPASSRPYIGGSQNNSFLDLVFGYNGFGRLNGNEIGSVGGGPPGTGGRWGETGLHRLFNTSYGGQISWLLPAALILLGGLLVASWRTPRTDRTRAGALLWGGWLLVTGLSISLAEGIIHPYYTVALAPAIGALVGIGAVELWRNREHLIVRMAAAVVVVVTAWWSYRLLSRTPDWRPGLAGFVLIGGIVAAVLLVFADRRPQFGALTVAAICAVTLAGPAAYTSATVSTGHSGALPMAGPSVSTAFRRIPTMGSWTTSGGTGRHSPGGQVHRLPARPTFPSGRVPNRGVGGILDATDPSGQLAQLLARDADHYTWVAATVSANQAAGYQLATGDPVMAIGGFNGTDPAPSLARFERYVAEGRIHYYIGRGGPMGGGGSAAAEISTWVRQNFEPLTVDGVVLYDLSAGPTATVG